jgi:zinc protease
MSLSQPNFRSIVIDTDVSPLARAANADLQEPQLLLDRLGLPLWTARLDGPVTGALMFRVGSGDEPLTHRGLTHLTEHLALSSFHDRTLQWNGFVDLNRTVFHATGPQENVEQFLMHTARQLSRVDADLLRRERSVLTAEARSSAPSIVGDLLSRRYGTQQWGTAAWWEIAIPEVTVETIEEWQQRWFTRENAVIWMTAAPTPSMKIDLHSGARMLPFDPPELLSGRGWLRHDSRCVAMLARAERSHAIAAATGVIVSELHRTLRERGLGYSVQGFWHRLTAKRGALSVVTDLVAKRELEHVSVFLDVIDQLCSDIPDRVLEERRTAFEQVSATDYTRAQLDAWSLNLLLGMERTTAAAEWAEECHVTRDQIVIACDALRQDVLLALPPTVAPPESRLTKLDATRDVAVGGRPHKLRVLGVRDDAKVTLTVGESGISWQSSTATTTVRWDKVTALMRWRDGSRLAIDQRGSAVLVEPTRYHGGREAAAEVDRHIDPRLAVDVGSRYGTLVITDGPPKMLRRLTAMRKVSAAGIAILTLLSVGGAFVPRRVDPVGLVVAALGVAAFFAFAVVTTRRPSPFLWDNGNTRTNVPEELDRSTWYVPGGLLFGWAIQHGHLDARWAAAHQAELSMFAEGAMTAPVLYRTVGGLLGDDMLDEVVNEFFTDFLAQSNAGYNHDLRVAFPKISFFSIPDTAASQQVASRIVEKAFVDWHRYYRFRIPRHSRRLVRSWEGPQSTYWAAGLVQRARRRRWR